MVVWFRYGSCTVGVEDGIVRAADFAQLMELIDAIRTVQDVHGRLVEDAEQEVAQLRSEAIAEVQVQLSAAQTERERAYGEGLAQGLERAAEQWTEGALLEAASTQRTLVRQTERLSRIVSLALEHIFEQEDRVTLFNRSLNAISRLVQDVPMATLRVCPAELESALAAVSAFAPCTSGRIQIEVKPDSDLAPGSCLFESDQGLIDAGLQTQLEAIQRAMDRAAQHMVLQIQGEQLAGDGEALPSGISNFAILDEA